MKPIFVYNKWLPFGDFTAITILMWVFVKMRQTPTGGWYAPRITDRLRRHETWHVWQQMTLLVTGVLIAAICMAFGLFSWWVWAMPILLPFGLYILCWLLEVLLPPYKSAYKDICFEGEARYNEYNAYPKFYPFSFLKFIPNKNWRELGVKRYVE